jgi:aryl-alcohol dehydrogenase-like predicted oxidoreductase
MKKLPLGPGGPEVSVVGFGGMPLSISNRPDESAAIRVIHESLDSGMTLIDTADVYCLDESEYGHNERLVRKAMDSWGGARDKILIATKGGLNRSGENWGQDARPESLRAACERSLKALGTDCIDLYQLHAPDPEVPFVHSVQALAQLRKEGKIRRVGLSNVSVDQIREAGEIVPVTTVQNRLNPFFREAIEEGVVAFCGEKGIGFLAYSPVGGGRLNKKLPDHPVLREIAGKHGATPHQLVLAWVRAQGPSVIIIPGARTVEHALSSVKAAELELSAEELARIDDAEFSRE